MNELNTILTCVAGVNIITFILMGADKQKAIKHQYRIPERTFWLLSLIGGALGSLIGMNAFHHKTKHCSFVVGMPLLLVFQCIALLYLFMS